jgi:hypothetical protein
MWGPTFMVGPRASNACPNFFVPTYSVVPTFMVGRPMINIGTTQRTPADDKHRHYTKEAAR